jgi:hypothetical protein
MTTSELIAILKEKDPSGQMRVLIDDKHGLVGIDCVAEKEIAPSDVGNSFSRLKYEDVGKKVLVL